MPLPAKTGCKAQRATAAQHAAGSAELQEEVNRLKSEIAQAWADCRAQIAAAQGNLNACSGARIASGRREAAAGSRETHSRSNGGLDLRASGPNIQSLERSCLSSNLALSQWTAQWKPDHAQWLNSKLCSCTILQIMYQSNILRIMKQSSRFAASRKGRLSTQSLPVKQSNNLVGRKGRLSTQSLPVKERVTIHDAQDMRGMYRAKAECDSAT